MRIAAGVGGVSPRRRASSVGRSSRTWRTKIGVPLTSISRSPSLSRTLLEVGAGSEFGRGAGIGGR